MPHGKIARALRELGVPELASAEGRKSSLPFPSDEERALRIEAEADGFTWIRHASQESVTRERRHAAPSAPHDRKSIQFRRLTRLANWPALEHLADMLPQDLSALVNTELTAASEPAAELPGLVGAALTLTQPQARTEVTVSVWMQEPVAKRTVEGLLGVSDSDTVQAFLCEAANMAAGALKRCVLDSTQLTLGLPRYLASEADVGLPDLVFDFGSGDVVVRCTVTAEWAEVKTVPLGGLREGMVCASDVRIGDTVLVESGQRLTCASIDVLRALLPVSTLLQVVDVPRLSQMPAI